MVKNPRFQVRDEGLEELDEALVKLGYIDGKGKPDRSGWYREMKRELIKKAEQEAE